MIVLNPEWLRVCEIVMNQNSGSPTRSKQVEQWYRKNLERLSIKFSKINLSEKDWDTLRGGVVIEIEGPTLVANLAFWYKGDVSVSVLKKGSQNPVVLDDRVLDPEEDVGSLLDGYLRDIERFA